MARARRPAALLLFDLDRFKSINDRFGHGAGDGVLTAFCQLATSLLRPTDLFGRIGGEQFASLLPDTTRQDALLLAERLRAAFEATTHTLADGPLSATASGGVAISDDASSILLPSWMWQIRRSIAPRQWVAIASSFRRIRPRCGRRSRAPFFPQRWMAADLVFDGPGRREAAGSSVGIPGSTWICIVSG